MMFQDLREQVVAFGRRMYTERMTRGSGGYICVRDPESGLICSTPSSKPYMKLTAEDIIVSDIDGKVIEGNGVVSSEWLAVKAILSHRPDIQALVHTHSTYATTIGALQVDLPAACFTLPMCGAPILRCTGYHSFYSQDLADDILEKMEGSKAVLMGNHGLVAGGDTLDDAYYLAEEMEFCCEVYWRAKCIGEPYIMTQEEIEQYYQDRYKYIHINDE